MHLIGATVEQSRRMLVCEAVAGSLGAVAGTIPFAIAKTGEPLAALATLPHSLAIAVGTGTTLGVTALAGRRVIRTAAA